MDPRGSASERAGSATARPRAAGAAAGLAGSSAAVLTLALVHTAAPRVPFAPVAVAQWIVRIMPGAIDTFFIDHFHHLALPLAEGVTGAGFLTGGALLGLLHTELDRCVGPRGPSTWFLALLPLWGLPIAVAPLGASTVPRSVFALATLPASLVGAGIAFAVAGRPDRSARRGLEPSIPADPSRRRAVASLAVGVAGLLLGGANLGSEVVTGDLGGRGLRFSRLSRAVPPRGSATDAEFRRLSGLTPEITSTARFYVVDEAIVDPVLDRETWRLSVGGLVHRPFSLSYADLERLPAGERFQTLECISNPVGGQLISTARWEGIPLVEILDRAGVQPSSVEVVFRSADGYSDSLPIEQAMDERTLVALGMNGDELTRAHGFPARLLSVGTYGMKNPKWLTSIEVVDRPYTGFWEERGWSRGATVRTGSRLDLPRPGSRVTGPTTIAGIAFSGDRGISKVQVSTDDGATWNDALLETALSPYAWVRWLYRWVPAGPGVYTLRARAFDVDGVSQISTWAQPHPDGATGYPVIAVSVAGS